MLHFPPAIEEHAAEFAACYGYSHQAVSREAGIHSVFSTKKTNSLRVSPPHLWLTHVAPTTTATTTQLRRRPALSSSNTTSRSARRSQWGDEFAFAAVAGQPKPDPLDPVAVAAAAPPPEQELTSIGPAPEVPAARAASGESHRFRLVNFHKFLRESWVDALRDIT